MERQKLLSDGLMSSTSQKFEEAIRLYDMAAQLNTNNSESLMGKARALAGEGNFLLNQGHIKDATELYNQSMLLSPHNPYALAGLENVSSINNVSSEQNKSKTNVTVPSTNLIPTDLTKPKVRAPKANITIRKPQDDYIYWLNRSLELSRNGSLDEALASFNKTLNLDSHRAEAWIDKGDTLYKLGRYEAAADCYDQAVAIDSKNPRAWEGKGLAVSKTGRYKMARLSLDAALLRDPNNEELLYNEAQVQIKLKEYQDALNAFNKLDRMKPGNIASSWQR